MRLRNRPFGRMMLVAPMHNFRAACETQVSTACLKSKRAPFCPELPFIPDEDRLIGRP
jgi:hypothetical protein